MAKAKTVEKLQREFANILRSKKDEFFRVFKEEVLGIVGIVGDADLAGNLTGKGKMYVMYGAGCSVSWIKGKGIKGKKYEQAAGGAMRIVQDEFTPKLVKLHPDKPVRPLMAQDYRVNSWFNAQASQWFKENGVEAQFHTALD